MDDTELEDELAAKIKLQVDKETKDEGLSPGASAKRLTAAYSEACHAKRRKVPHAGAAAAATSAQTV